MSSPSWGELLQEVEDLDPGLLQWWISDRQDCSLSWIPMKEPVSEEDLVAWKQALPRLRAGEPVQYVAGRAPFRNLQLRVDERVLIPRPETEQLVEIALKLPLPAQARVLDVGTGSGCIALSLKQERPDWQLTAVDLSEDALALATTNAAEQGLDVCFQQADLLQGLSSEARNLIMANLPYIGKEEEAALPENVRNFEPHLALFAEGEGTALMIQLMDQAWQQLVAGGYLLLESGETQQAILGPAAEQRGYEVSLKSDLAGRERFWVLRKPA